MEQNKQQNLKPNYLCIEFHDKDGKVNPNLSKCPANPETVVAALQFLSDGCDFVVSIQHEPINFETLSNN